MARVPITNGVGPTVDISEIEGATLIIESEGISSNDNDTTIPTSAAVKDYVDNASKPGSSITIDNTGHEVLTATDVETAFDQTDIALLNARATGVRYGGALTDQGSGVVRITAGEGGILDNSTPSSPTYDVVTWTQTDLDLSGADGVYYVYVNSSGTVTSTTTAPSHDDYRTDIYLHRVSIVSSVYSASTAIPQPLQQYGPQIWDIWRALGYIKKDLTLSAASTDLTVAISSGEAYVPGGNFFTSAVNPHEITYSSKNPATFQHVDQDGDRTADRTAIDVGNYDNAGTITAISGASSRATIFTVKMFPGSGGNVRIFYGQTVYNSVSLAQQALFEGTYSPTLPAIYDDAITLGWIIAQKGATNLSDGTQVFVTANKFGGVGGSIATVGGGVTEFLDSQFRVQDDGDTTKQVAFEVSGITTATTRTLTVPDASFTIPSQASSSEVNTGTDTVKAVTPDSLAGSNIGTKAVSIQVFDGATDVTTGDGKAYITIPASLNGMNLIRAQATVVTAGTTNATTVMIHNLTDTTDMLSGAISIASGGTVGTVGTISGAADDVATNDILRVDVDSVSTTAPQGLIVVLEFQLP